jgi:sulfur-carrier protein
MKLTLLAFADARVTLGFSSQVVECQPADTPLSVTQALAPNWDHTWTKVALDGEFVSWETPIGSASELAYLPPVSGG